jgi:hypothetical protein
MRQQYPQQPDPCSKPEYSLRWAIRRGCGRAFQQSPERFRYTNNRSLNFYGEWASCTAAADEVAAGADIPEHNGNRLAFSPPINMALIRMSAAPVRR